MSVAIYSGSFDPITNGHMDIIKRGAKVFDKIIVGVLVNVDKKHLFEIDERVNLIKRVTNDMENVEVVSFNGLLVDLLKEYKAWQDDYNKKLGRMWKNENRIWLYRYW